jgi:hypothetical protein
MMCISCSLLLLKGIPSMRSRSGGGGLSLKPAVTQSLEGPEVVITQRQPFPSIGNCIVASGNALIQPSSYENEQG